MDVPTTGASRLAPHPRTPGRDPPTATASLGASIGDKRAAVHTVWHVIAADEAFVLGRVSYRLHGGTLSPEPQQTRRWDIGMRLRGRGLPGGVPREVDMNHK
ncbi:Hypp1867 [Branchiostoma lanceolatum]|uniref:Hypp1867 protein n=1 Tax=Branchiostoma lanceolatum TaxID=7740 RepID=A0A8K0EMP4_BRALA|nr:Hypp1867 [Branchiostoma lanceolatum]